MTPTHSKGILSATTKSNPAHVSVDKIASVGHPLTAYADVKKIKHMRENIAKGKPLKPIKLSPLTPELRERHGIEDPTKKYFLENGHHRLAAAKLEGLKRVRAVDYHHGKRL